MGNTYSKQREEIPWGPLEDVPLSVVFSPVRHWRVPPGISVFVSVRVTIWWLRQFIQPGVKNDVLG